MKFAFPLIMLYIFNVLTFQVPKNIKRIRISIINDFVYEIRT